MFADIIATTDRDMIDVLGEPVVYQPDVGSAIPLTGVFDAAYVLAKGSPEAGVGAAGPAVFVLLADLQVDPDLDDHAMVTIRGVDYHVTSPEPDGVGGILFLLRAVT